MDTLPSPTIAPALPTGSRFASVSVVRPESPARREVEAFIHSVYQHRFAADVVQFMPVLVAFRDAAGGLRAVVGVRSAESGPLFVEQYLDNCAEAAVASALGTAVDRGHVAEVGSMAACDPGDAREIIVYLTRWLYAAGVRWVLFAATRQLRNAFARLRLAPVLLVSADPARLGVKAAAWGTYYRTEPQVVCGDIAAGHAFLARSGSAPAAPSRQHLMMAAMAWAGCR